MENNFSIVPLDSSLIKAVVSIHSESLPDDFLPNLGTDFLENIFYPSVLRSDNAKVFMALSDDKQPVGFVLVTLDSGDFLKGIIKDRVLDFVKVGIRSSFSSLKNMVHNFQIVSTSLFSSPAKGVGEIYVIAVKGSSRGKGTGKLLVKQSVEYLRACGIHGIRIKTLASNIKWIGFFKKNGWNVEREFRLIENEYVSLFLEID